MKIARFNLLTATLLLLSASVTHAQHTQLRKEINRIAQTTKGKVGVAICLLENNDTLTYNNQHHYVLHSVAKYAVALDMLHEIDLKHFKLNQLIHITKADLPPLYSPLRDKYPNGNVDISIKELLSYTISLSDNNACDILYKHLGGTQHVNQFIHSLGIKQMEIEATEADMASAWPVQYTDWTQPYEQIKLLKLLYSGSLLSKESNKYLWKIMLATSTAPKRLKGLLPAGTAVAHKSGTSGTNAHGLSPATNDMGIILLPNGKRLAIAVFITDALESDDARDLIIAQIAKAAYTDFNRKTK
jgi:beta-lactamase class A